jgi:hypothetical protein
MVAPFCVRLTVIFDALCRAWARDRERPSLLFAGAWWLKYSSTSARSSLVRFSETPRALAVSLAVANRPVTLIGTFLL